MQSWTQSTVFSLTIMLEIVTNTTLSISSSVMYVCHVSVHTLYCSVVAETLPAISETIWWSCSFSQVYSLAKLSLLCERSVSYVESNCLNRQHRLSGLWAQHPFEVEQINSNNNEQCISAHSTKKSITSGLSQHWYKYTWAVFNLNAWSPCKVYLIVMK